MNRNYTRFLSVFLYIFFLLLSLFILFLNFNHHKYTFPSVNIDEASFFSPAYNLAKFSKLSTDVHEGFLPGAEKYTYWIPPFYIFSLGIFFKIFSPTILTAKIFSFINILAAGILSTFLTGNKSVKISLPALLLICPFVIISSAYIRMEALGLMLSILFFVLLLKDCSVIFTGIVSAFLFMTHPMWWGIVLCTGLYYLLKNFKQGLWFGVIFILVSVPYFIYILKAPDLYIQQMNLQLRRKDSHFINTGFQYLFQILPLVIFSIYFLLRSDLEKNKKNYFLLSLLFTFLLFLKSGEFNYHIYLVPFFILSVAMLGNIPGKKKVFTYSFFSFYCFFIVLLYFKMQKNEIAGDRIYYSLLRVINKNKEWRGKKIFVLGKYDLAKFFTQEGQHVRRMNAVAQKPYDNFIWDFDCIVSTSSNNKEGVLLSEYGFTSVKQFKIDSSLLLSIYVK